MNKSTLHIDKNDKKQYIETINHFNLTKFNKDTLQCNVKIVKKLHKTHEIIKKILLPIIISDLINIINEYTNIIFDIKCEFSFHDEYQKKIKFIINELYSEYILYLAFIHTIFESCNELIVLKDNNIIIIDKEDVLCDSVFNFFSYYGLKYYNKDYFKNIRNDHIYITPKCKYDQNNNEYEEYWMSVDGHNKPIIARTIKIKNHKIFKNTLIILRMLLKIVIDNIID